MHRTAAVPAIRSEAPVRCGGALSLPSGSCADEEDALSASCAPDEAATLWEVCGLSGSKTAAASASARLPGSAAAVSGDAGDAGSAEDWEDEGAGGCGTADSGTDSDGELSSEPLSSGSSP